METALQTLRARLAAQCDTLRRWHHFATVMLLRNDGSVVASSSPSGEQAPLPEGAKNQVVVKLLAERLLLVAIVGPEGAHFVPSLGDPDHAWLQGVRHEVERYLEAAGAEAASRELPVVTDADVDRLFNAPATAP